MGTIDLNRLEIFLAVAETSSFSAAARKLGVPKSSVSRGLAGLEDELGVRLVHRTTRHVALSTAGATFKERISGPLAELERSDRWPPELESEPSASCGSRRPPTLPPWCSPRSSRASCPPPAVEVEMRLTSAIVDLVAEGFDVALRISGQPLADSSLVARRWPPSSSRSSPRPFIWRGGRPRSLRASSATTNGW